MGDDHEEIFQNKKGGLVFEAERKTWGIGEVEGGWVFFFSLFKQVFVKSSRNKTSRLYVLVINTVTSEATTQTSQYRRPPFGATMVAPDAACRPRLPAFTMFGLTQPTRESAQGVVAGAWPPLAVMVVLLDQNARTKGIERASMPS